MTNIEKTDILQDIINKSDEGFNKGKIYGYLLYEYNLSTKDAKGLLYEALGKGTSNAPNRDKHIECIRKFYGKIDKKDLLIKMCAIGGTHSSNNHKYAYIKDMIEYADQELKAYEKSITKEIIESYDNQS